ncbi:MAG: insulinase family protein [Cytophagaceae bacterium]|nr:insulinase family protein [Cytophagaceae bacterium]
MVKEFEIIELSNGIRVIFKEVPYSKIVHCGYILDSGTRDEIEGEHGIAHFWEHMSFKGTKKRSPFRVLSSLEIFGGELNAYTTKEKMWFHASVPGQHVEKAFDVLTDIVFESTFPAKELEVERGVILEEISMYLDTPEEYIQDEFEHRLFKGQSLGNYILGTPESVASFSTQKIKKFVKETVDTERIVFSIVGNIKSSEVHRLVDRYIKVIPKHTAKRKRQKSKKKTIVFSVEETRNNNQAHCIIGCQAYSLKDDKRLPLFMLSNWLAGPGLTSTLNMVLREKKGYVYTIEANYQPFVDTGMVNFYFGTDKKHLYKSIDLIQKELQLLKDKALSSFQLRQMKEQVLGQMLMAEESLSNMMQMMGKSLLDYGRVESFSEVEKKVNKLTPNALQEVAQEIFEKDKMSQLILLPE